MESAMRLGYSCVRGLHLALIAALVPAALWHYLALHPGANFLVLGIAWLASVIALLFLLPIDQAQYPPGLVPALFRTGPMVLNVAFAINAQRDLLSAAFFGASALMAGLAALLTFGSILELWPHRAKSQGKEEGERRRLAAHLLVPLAALAWLAVAGVVPTLIDGLRASSSLGGAASVSVWLLHAVGTAQGWFRLSVWGGAVGGEWGGDASSAWQKATAGAFAAAFLATVVVEIWLGLASTR